LKHNLSACGHAQADAELGKKGILGQPPMIIFSSVANIAVLNHGGLFRKDGKCDCRQGRKIVKSA